MGANTDIAQHNTEHGRFYSDAAGLYPSVTTMLSMVPREKWILEWEARTPPEEQERARNRATKLGTAVHEVAERYLNGYSVSLPQLGPSIATLAKEIIEMCNRVEVIYASERFLVNREQKYAGTVDFAGKAYGTNEVWDFKTGRYAGFGPDAPLSYRIQLALYAMALESNTAEKFERGRIILSSMYDGLKVYVIDLERYKPMAILLARDYWRRHGERIETVRCGLIEEHQRDFAETLQA